MLAGAAGGAAPGCVFAVRLRELSAATGVLVDWRRVSRSSCDWGQLILMALRLLSQPTVFGREGLARHSSEAWSCGPEESSEPRCDPKTSAGKALAKQASLAFALGWQHTRAQRTSRRRYYSCAEASKKLSQSLGRARRRASFAATCSHWHCARGRARCSRSTRAGSRTPKQTRE